MGSPPTTDLAEQERSLVVRRIEPADFPAIIALQLECFPGMEPWDEAHLADHVDRFPEGQLCVELDGDVVASCGSLIVAYDDFSDWHDYRSLVVDGTLLNHDPEGDTLYGIELQVAPPGPRDAPGASPL